MVPTVFCEMPTCTMLGQGAFGKVYALNHNIVLKEFEKQDLNIQLSMERECAMYNLALIDGHEHIVKVLARCTLPNLTKGILFTRGGEDMLNLIEVKDERFFQKKTLFLFVRQIIKAVNYLHTCNVYHCDIKLENILVDKQNLVQLCDFGLAHCDAWKCGSYKTLGHFGTASYLPHKEIVEDPSFIRIRDEWAVGVVFFSMAYKCCLYEIATDRYYSHMYDTIILKTESNFYDLPWVQVSELNREQVSWIEFFLREFISPTPTPITMVHADLETARTNAANIKISSCTNGPGLFHNQSTSPVF